MYTATGTRVQRLFERASFHGDEFFYFLSQIRFVPFVTARYGLVDGLVLPGLGA
jgi:hypothetical protein